MALVVFFLLLALIFGGVGLFVESMKWALIIAVAFLIASYLTNR